MEDFINSLIPANYFLTKSMEFTRETVSGTLWYLKKYLVLYNSIFLNDSVSTEEGIGNIIKIFNDFIDSLPEESKKDATNFFFPEEVDIRNNYNNFVHFKGNKMFLNKSEENEYMDTVRKYYFVYLMQIGGQSGVKKYIREELYKKEFSMEKIDEIIENYLQIHPEISYTVSAIRGDYHAALRNERQILWYYGFVHSKSAGAADIEFSSLTPIGEIAIKANYDEFRCIWEHQKLKMISQPVTVELSKIENNPYADGNKFAINYSPYITILKYLSKKEKITKKEYQFIISRIKNNNISQIQKNLNNIISQIDQIQNKVMQFQRSADINKEDFDKEIKKYILGLRNDLPKDYMQNDFGICKQENRNGIILEDDKKLNEILLIYNQINKYKINNNKELFEKCEKELKTKYTEQSSGKKYKINPKVKISWDLYNIHLDKVIILSIILLDYAIKNNKQIENLKIENEDIKKMKYKYPNLFMACNFNSTKELNFEIKEIVNYLNNKELENLHLESTQHKIEYINEYTALNIEDLKAKIIEISNRNNNIVGRVRNMKLIALIKTLYQSLYSDEHKLIKCECCGKTTFLTNADEAYLEYHHLLPFNIVDGPDHYINIFGICPDCHSRIHHGKDDMKENIYANLNINNHMRKSILERFKTLYNQKQLKSYQLEYALAEQMINEQEYNEIIV